jgi:peptide subunit release factor 1 (eRF1)
MLDAKLVQSLPQIPAPVLTAYLETNPADSRNLRHPPGYLIWLKSQAKNLEERVPQAERKAFREQVQRLKEYLSGNPANTRGLVVFAGPQVWHLFLLRVQTENELFWGSPSLAQLLWLMEEHRPCGVVLVDRSGARFFHYWMGELSEDHEARLNIDTAEWKRKEWTPPSQPGVAGMRGTDRHSFEHRVEAQYVRFFSKEAEHVRAWADRRNLNSVFLAGPPKLVELAWAELPKGLRQRAVLIKEDIEHLPLAEMEARIESEVQRWDREYERALVNRLLDSADGSHAVIGLDTTLADLQEGLTRGIVTVHGIDAEVSECTKCGWTDHLADTICPICGGTRRSASLKSVLPQLARRYKAPLEVVAEDAEEKLRQVGGIGAWLHGSRV